MTIDVTNVTDRRDETLLECNEIIEPCAIPGRELEDELKHDRRWAMVVGLTLELGCGATRAGAGWVYARGSPRQLQ